ncbi:hypothetical protein WA158_002838 [Blastocystis sp. Blastoise]
MTYKSNPENDEFLIFDGAPITEDSVLIFSYTGTEQEMNQESTYITCLQFNHQYSLFLNSTTSTSWEHGAEIKIYYLNHLILKDINDDIDSFSKEISFIPLFPINPDTSLYYSDICQESSDWYKTTSPTLWSNYTIQTLPSSSSFSDISITQYYYIPFLYDDSYIDFSSIYISISTYAGAIVYLNEQQVYSIHMNSEDLYTCNSTATTESSNYISYSFSIPAIYNYLKNGENILAIEIHKYTTIPTDIKPFFLLSYLPNHENMIKEGIPSSDIDTSSLYPLSNLFDQDITTKTLSGPRCIGATYQYTYNTKYIINHYSLVSANSCNQRHPSGWTFEASNDNGNTWTLLDYQNNQLFTLYQQKKEYFFYNTKEYNQYRLVVNECNNIPLDEMDCGIGNNQLAELTFYLSNIPISCNSQNNYTNASDNSYGYKSCPLGYSGILRRYCQQGQFQEEENLCILESPVSFSYSTNILIFYRYQSNTFIPNVMGAELTYSITPSLPQGLSLNPNTGILSGTSSTLLSLTLYYLTISNSKGSINYIFTLQVKDNICESMGEWPAIETESQAELPCTDPSLYEGQRKRLCYNGNPPYWGDIIDECLLLLPTILFPIDHYIFYINISIPEITATLSRGENTTLSITPSLPDGLSFDTNTGLLYGVPTTIHNIQPYIFTLTNPRGNSTFILSITIQQGKCISTDIWPETYAGLSVTIPCSNSEIYQGSRTRDCIPGNPPYWGDSYSDTCALIPPVLIYDNTTIIGYIDDSLTITPLEVSGGDLQDMTITPELPRGLTFDVHTGIITGTPVNKAHNIYTISLSNSDSSISILLTITIEQVYCESIDYWPRTERKSSVSLMCTPYKGIQTRTCIYDSYGRGTWSSINTNKCFNYTASDIPPIYNVYITFALLVYGVNKNIFEIATNYEDFRMILANRLNSEISIDPNNVQIVNTDSYMIIHSRLVVRVLANDLFKGFVINSIRDFVGDNSSAIVNQCKQHSNTRLNAITSIYVNDDDFSIKEYSITAGFLTFSITSGIVIAIVILFMLLAVMNPTCKQKKPMLKPHDIIKV